MSVLYRLSTPILNEHHDPNFYYMFDLPYAFPPLNSFLGPSLLPNP